jgi:hypothetical protein
MGDGSAFDRYLTCGGSLCTRTMFQIPLMANLAVGSM